MSDKEQKKSAYYIDQFDENELKELKLIPEKELLVHILYSLLRVNRSIKNLEKAIRDTRDTANPSE